MFRLSALLIILVLISGCANLQKFARNQAPRAKLLKTEITALSFDGIELTFDVEIENPNPITISMAGFDYTLKLNGNRFIDGNMDKKTTLKANGKSHFPVPVSFSFSELYKTYKSLEDASEADYQLDLGIKVDIPILGPQRIPVTTSGKFPIVRLPLISLKNIKLDLINITSADLTFTIDINNPNTFGFDISNFKYYFDIAGSQWATGALSQRTNLDAGKNGEIKVPVNVNFLEMGRSVYNLINGSQKLDYKISGKLDLSSDLKLLGTKNIHFNRSGQVKLIK